MEGVQAGALHYVLDTDGLPYLAQLLAAVDKEIVQVRWLGWDQVQECQVRPCQPTSSPHLLC